MLPVTTHKKVGQISEDSLQFVYNFVLQNKEEVPLRIDTVYSDCACALLQWPKKEIAPQTEALLKVSYDLRSQLGSFEKKFRVEGNQGHYKQTFTLSGEVVPGRSQAASLYAFRKNSLQLLSEVLHFGTIMGEDPVSKYFFAYNSSEDTLYFRSAELPTHLSLRFLPEQLAPKEVARWQLHYDPRRRSVSGYQLDEILVYVTESKEVTSVKCFVAATTVAGGRNYSTSLQQGKNMPSVFFLERREYNFGRVRPREALIASFPFKNTGKGELRIAEVRSTCDCIHVQNYQKTYGPKEKGEISLVVDASQLIGRQTYLVEVHTNDTTSPVHLLKVDFFVQKE